MPDPEGEASRKERHRIVSRGTPIGIAAGEGEVRPEKEASDQRANSFGKKEEYQEEKVLFKGKLVRLAGIEPATCGFEVR
ncbi:MAG: hypothetical protein D084_Lepto4C00431G0002 [Leptospirillum sp. Group IV 'UBA BS']|nr:MAG: hypothetical protein D084_Lepto4C00431G0002 [Leptospirillum sp. Group IV 'UBA BS']